MRVQDPLLLTHRIDRKAESAILKGNGLAWLCFDLAVFALIILFFA